MPRGGTRGQRSPPQAIFYGVSDGCVRTHVLFLFAALCKGYGEGGKHLLGMVYVDIDYAGDHRYALCRGTIRKREDVDESP